MIEIDGQLVTTDQAVQMLAEAARAVHEARRDALMRDLAGIERALGYGKPDGKPTTAELWRHWRSNHGKCRECCGVVK